MTDLLSIGRSGVLAYQGALKTVGENVTNSDTDGYSRRTVLLKEQGTYATAFTLTRTAEGFSGVSAVGVQRVWDQYKASNAWSANSDSQGAGTRAQYLSTMESLLNDSDTGVGTRLTAMFTSATRLSASPADTNLRQAYIASIGDAVNAFHVTAQNLTKLSGTIGTQADLLVSRANSALDTLAKINLAIRVAPPDSVSRAQLADNRDALLGELSGAMAIDTAINADGTVTVRQNNSTGAVLVSARSPTPSLLSVAAASDGQLTVTVLTPDQTTTAATPTGGTLAGLIDAATTSAGRMQQLDGLASSLVDLLNVSQAEGLTDAGTAGIPMFDDTKRTAASITQTLSLPSDLALKDATGQPNGQLLKIIDTGRGANGVEQGWKSLVTDQALLVSSAKLQESAASTRKDTAYSALDAVTGVNLDNEAAELLRFQQAYSASAKVIQAARETLQDILKLF